MKSTEELSELFFQLFGKLKIISKGKGFFFFFLLFKKNIGNIVNLQCCISFKFFKHCFTF